MEESLFIRNLQFKCFIQQFRSINLDKVKNAFIVMLEKLAAIRESFASLVYVQCAFPKLSLNTYYIAEFYKERLYKL